MTYQTTAPRYAKPVPASTLPPVISPQPRHRPLRCRLVGAIVGAWEREREDHAFVIGAAFALVLVAALVAAVTFRA